MIIGEVCLKQFILSKQSFWTDFMTFYREFNGGVFDDNNFEVMMNELELNQNDEKTIHEFFHTIDYCMSYMYDELSHDEAVSTDYSMIVIDDKIILAYAFQTY